jgi:ParB-like chromosome segregation protein Spo0J
LPAEIEAINIIRKEIHNHSPLKHHPVDCVIWEKSNDVEGNEYNPNSVAPPEMKLLMKSIKEDGYTMPIVTFPNIENDKIKIVDGFHRRKSERTCKEISDSTFGRIPITSIRESQYDVSNRMASTIRHNRARGTHSVDLMVNIVAELVESNMGDDWIMKHIGMDSDELLRLKQISGLASLFKDKEFSKSWEI